MAWRKCTVIRCPMMIREGLRRLTIDPKHELADGMTNSTEYGRTTMENQVQGGLCACGVTYAILNATRGTR